MIYRRLIMPKEVLILYIILSIKIQPITSYTKSS